MKALLVIVVLAFCLPAAWIAAAVVIPIVLGALGLALVPVILLGKLLFPLFVIWVVWKLLIEKPRQV
jgi:hypothetical protein